MNTPATLDELKELLQATLKASEENTKILKAMRRDAVIGGVVKFLVWVILIAASFYFSMKFLEPYLGVLGNTQQEGMTQDDYKALFDQYKDLLGQ